MKENKNIHFVLIFSFFVCLLFAASKIIASPVFAYFAGFLSLMFCLLSSAKLSFLFLCVVCPNTYYFMIGSSALCGYLAIICFFKFLLERKIRTFYGVFTALSLLTIFCFICAFLNSNVSLIMTAVKTFFLIADVFLFFKCYCCGKTFDDGVFSCFLWGTMFSVIFGLAYYLLTGRTIIILTTYQMRFSGLANDPNYFSSTLSFAIALIAFRFFETRKIRLTDLLMLAVFLGIGIITLSRGFILSAGLCILLALFYLFLTRRINAAHKFILLVLLGLVGTFGFIRFGNIIDVIITRFNSDSSAGGSGRVELWTWFLHQVSSSPKTIVFGCGHARDSVNAGLVINIEHNTFVQILYECGYFGLFLYFVVFLTLYKSLRGKKSFRHYIYAYLPILSVVLSYFFLSAINGENFILTAAVSIILLSKSVIVKREMKVENATLYSVHRQLSE